MTSGRQWLSLAAGTMLGRRYPFVLCYHGVGALPANGDPHGLFVSQDLFVNHLDVIQHQGYKLLTVGDLSRLLRSGSNGAHSGSITFDDALVRTAREGVPILLERGIPSSMFVTTGLMGRPHPDLDGEMVMNAEEVVELAAAGVEIGAHSVDHTWLNRLEYDDVLDQLCRSKAVLEDLLGKPVTSMAYPYGQANAQTMRAAREAGYELACICSGPGPWQPLSFPREPIYASATPLRLRLKMAGLYGPAYAIRNMQSIPPSQRI
jgi:peptidoglycan/xylan/chitin deacetylase (PgdA/CDA1 family)